MPCPKCGGPLQRVTEFTEMADNFVLHVNRVADHQTGEKIKTAIELPFQPIKLCGKDYVLNAIIRHRGNTVHAGHYTIFRKRSRDWNTEAQGTSTWYHIDDEDVSTINAKDIKDHGRNGQSTMLLFKTVDSMD
jgi:ubiquitin C-terminal hydrolase